MLDLDTSGIAAYADWLEGEPARIKLEIQQAYRKWALTIHEDITRLTPQWSGNLAANWMVEIGAPAAAAQFLGDPTVVFHDESTDLIWGREPYSRGMEPAVSISLDRAKSLRIPAMHEVIYIHNPTTYAEEVETDSGERRIRPINRLPRTETGKIAMVYHAFTKFSEQPLP